jgi:IclR family acetate operon transcriptional repressor
MATEAPADDVNLYGIRAVERTCDLLDTLAAAGGPVSLTSLAKACGLPKTSAFRYLSTLVARNYVERVGDSNDFRLGVGVYSLQADHLERLGQIARPHLERLRDELGETANMGILVGREVAYVEIVESTHAVRLAARPRDRDALHCTALGKVLLARIPVEKAANLVGERFDARTEHTLLTWPALRDELDLVRTQGYAVDDEENEIGGRCIAVPIPVEAPSVAISVSSVTPRLPMEKVASVAARLHEVADLIAQEASGL